MDDLEENRQTNVPCQRIFAEKWALLGSAICSRYTIVHFVMKEHTFCHHNTVQLYRKGVTRKASVEAGIRRNAICYNT